ncbi:hypothetical protein [Streptomyces purpureus]|uniref:PE-PGRS family protein n=1 Tax=Streptomyces purpureus TaxID=1951 RepID=A0A918LLV9_9ACTN|nr:hypothetical protein [Streptomyces purpureus]GGT14660.1 hypothetical protein GCM10014713_04260 [Streptomyces purpureus]
MTAGWMCRAIRAAVFAAVCVLLAALGHSLMSGTPVPGWALVAGATAAGAVAWAVGGRERGRSAVVAVAVGAQAALHTAFSFAQASAQPATADGTSFAREWARHLLCGDMAAPPEAEATRLVTAAGLGGHLHEPPPGTDRMSLSEHAAHTLHLGTDTAAAPAAAAHDMGLLGGSSTGMLAAHLLAALVCGLWLAHGERAAFRILRAVACRLVAPLRLLLLPPAPPHLPRIRAPRRRAARAPRRLLISLAITFRGPPQGTAVV